MRVMVAGSVLFGKKGVVYRVLDTLHPSVIIEGGMLGPDKYAADYAKERGIFLVTAPLERDAGTRVGRKRMLRNLLTDTNPDTLVMFGGAGHNNELVKLAHKIGVLVVVVPSNTVEGPKRLGSGKTRT